MVAKLAEPFDFFSLSLSLASSLDETNVRHHLLRVELTVLVVAMTKGQAAD